MIPCSLLHSLSIPSCSVVTRRTSQTPLSSVYPKEVCDSLSYRCWELRTGPDLPITHGPWESKLHRVLLAAPEENKILLCLTNLLESHYFSTLLFLSLSCDLLGWLPSRTRFSFLPRLVGPPTLNLRPVVGKLTLSVSFGSSTSTRSNWVTG